MDLLYGLSICLNILLAYRLYLEYKDRQQLSSSLRAFRNWNQQFMESVQSEQKDFIRTYLEYQRRGDEELKDWLQGIIDQLSED